MCVTVVQWPRSCLRADKPGFDSQRHCFLFLCAVFFLNTIFPFGLFSLFLLLTLLVHALGSIYILSLSPEFYFGKGILKAPDLHTGQAYDQKKTISCQEMSLLREFFSKLVNIITNNTQNTKNCTNLHPTPTSDPLAKVKLAFCTSS